MSAVPGSLRSLKFDLDRKTLEIMYFSFVRPVLEYGDLIFDNCPQYYKESLEKINVEAARIVTGATKLVSLELLYKECGWDTLEKRRENHKLIQFYKMTNGLTPEHLSNLIPQQHNQLHRYNTRHSDKIVNIPCKTTHHYQSFCLLVFDYRMHYHLKSVNVTTFPLLKMHFPN